MFNNIEGGVEDSVLLQGYHIFATWKKVIEHSISTETVYQTKFAEGKDDEEVEDNSINVNTKDGKQVNVSVTYSFHMNANNLPALFMTISLCLCLMRLISRVVDKI